MLADIDKDLLDKGNWAVPKELRTIDATDASSVLAYYAIASTTAAEDFDAAKAWSEVSGK